MPLRLALVGGAVRDWLLHRVHRDPWRGLPDLDLVVEDPSPLSTETVLPPAHRLAAALQRLEPSAVGFCRFHAAYGTVELELHGVLLDLASARCETYPQPAENPRVTLGGLETDLARRDFSINAMALVLDAAGTGEPWLLDPHGGQQDLVHRQLRLLHAASLRDDPTRLLRAARYAARLGFALAPESLRQAAETLAAWPWPWRPGDDPAQAPPALGTRLR
ncbi:MAG: CCA tRNA nucleotidyltransferase, partial [Cyanobacteriota bacterium]